MKIISNENFENELKNIAKEYDFELSDSVCRNLKIYKELLIDWNQKMNLTNITENYDIIIKHFIDCMQLLKYIDEKDKVIDVGTGAGMPGMVIAICFEDRLNITLLDSLNKRLIFLEEVKKTLGLKNVTIVHTRAEEGAHETEYREKFDVVV
ncbi:MAG: 16S rRNA (guanine(527)-N(7))-methyltransferase RsmG [Clostridia bacterium]|nr:16S rRNA (guanine(527)-N(7))-methyltransferase RsmG [Clostridia bacterium]